MGDKGRTVASIPGQTAGKQPRAAQRRYLDGKIPEIGMGFVVLPGPLGQLQEGNRFQFPRLLPWVFQLQQRLGRAREGLHTAAQRNLQPCPPAGEHRAARVKEGRAVGGRPEEFARFHIPQIELRPRLHARFREKAEIITPLQAK